MNSEQIDDAGSKRTRKNPRINVLTKVEDTAFFMETRRKYHSKQEKKHSEEKKAL